MFELPAWLSIGAAKTFLKNVSPRTWIEIGGALLLIVLIWHHLNKVYHDGYAAGEAHQIELQKKAEAQQVKKATHTSTQISVGTQKIGETYDKNVADIHRTAAALRMRGPSQVHVNLPSYQPAFGSIDAAGATDNGAAVASIEISWDEQVSHAEQCDIYRSQVMGLQDYVTLVQKWYGDFQRENSPAHDGK